jgi:alpha-glucoside transport system substrate-binding protein
LNTSSRRRRVAPLASIVVVGIALAGCSSTSSIAAVNVGKADGVVRIGGSLTGADATKLEESWATWASSNHIKIEYTGSSDFAEEIGTEAQKGQAPDLAIFEQPGLLNDFAKRGYIKPIPAGVKTAVTQNFAPQWATYTTVDGVDYGAPLLATLKGWVWYSPRQFAKWGVSVPKTWAELATLTEKIRGTIQGPPWCAGFDSGASSGDDGTDWIEDLVLREDGPSVYDQWVAHKIPFSDPRITKAFDDVGSILQNENYVNAGSKAGVASIATTKQSEVAQALQSGTCALTHESSSFDGDLQERGSSTVIGPQGDYWAFMLPPMHEGDVPVTGGGDFVAAFTDDSDTIKVQQYLASTAWASSRVSIGGVISPNRGISSSAASSPLLQKSIQLLQSPKTTFRFDGSDLMPSIVGSGSFWTEMVNWVRGTTTAKVASEIDGSWPDD